ncbi:unnamed protein product [Brugia timori]|uniref:Uncharacterized protein n=1 Tax=Brugia timori TaxID=42155 RepID=A0A0R3QM69_9BILA|nr:unnamed protein product [Brugia timori]
MWIRCSTFDTFIFAYELINVIFFQKAVIKIPKLLNIYCTLLRIPYRQVILTKVSATVKYG